VTGEPWECAEDHVYRSAAAWTVAIEREAIEWSAARRDYVLDERYRAGPVHPTERPTVVTRWVPTVTSHGPSVNINCDVFLKTSVLVHYIVYSSFTRHLKTFYFNTAFNEWLLLGHLVTARASDSMFYALTLCALQIVFTITITITIILKTTLMCA